MFLKSRLNDLEKRFDFHLTQSNCTHTFKYQFCFFDDNMNPMQVRFQCSKCLKNLDVLISKSVEDTIKSIIKMENEVSMKYNERNGKRLQ